MSDAGVSDASVSDASVSDGGPDAAAPSDAGWLFVTVPGMRCATAPSAGVAFSPGSSDELLVFLMGGGACWNTGMCQPSWVQWGPLCNYGNGPCFADAPGGTKPLAAFVDHPDPFPADGGGAFPASLQQVTSSLFFSRRAENPFRTASWTFVPYCTGDLHAGAAVRTYQVRPDLVGQPTPRAHHFAGAANLDAVFGWLRQRHLAVRTLWLVGVSAGGYGAQLNLHRAKLAFPEAEVHVLADSAPMVRSPYFDAMRREWNLQVPTACLGCDAGFPEVLSAQLDGAPTTRVGLLAFSEDLVLTRFFFAPGTTLDWAAPPTASYTQALNQVESLRRPGRFESFRRAGTEHVMLQLAGERLLDGGLSPSIVSSDGGVSLRSWVDTWATGSVPWTSAR